MANVIWNPGINAYNPTVELIVNQSSQSVEGNYSVLSYSLILHRPSNVSSSASKSYSVTINGVTVASGTTTLGGSGDKTIASGTTTVYHNADGTKTGVGFSFYMDIGITWSGSGTGNASGSGSMNLTTIPRATQPTLSSGTVTIGNAVTINTPRASGSFTHKIYYKWAGGNWILIVENVATSYAWTTPMTLCSGLPNSTSGKITIAVDTYNGSTYIGTKIIDLTLNVPSSVVPTVSISKSGVDLYSGYYVQGKSKVAVTLSASGAYGSTISSRSTTVKSGSNTITSSSANSFTSGVLNYSGIITIATTVTDSRGRTASASTTISVVAYSSPQITAFNAYRANSDGSSNPQGAYIKITGSASISSINNTNTKLTILRYREKGGTTWTNAIQNQNSYVISLEATVPADVNKSYEVQIYAMDVFNDTANMTNIGTAFVMMDFHSSGNSMAIGKVAEGRGLIEFGGGMADIYFNGNRMIDVVQTKFVVSRGVGLASWRKIAEMTTEIASGANLFSAIVDGLGDFASPTACFDIIHMSTRGNYPTCVCKRLMTGSILNNASFGVRNNTTTGLSELWIRMAPYNYEVHVMVLTAQNTMGIIRWGNLDSTNTEPTGITYITPT